MALVGQGISEMVLLRGDDVCSRRNGFEAKYGRRLHPEDGSHTPCVTACLEGRQGPSIGASDCVHAFADQFRAFVPMN